MAFQPVPLTASVEVQYVQNGQQCSITLYGYRIAGYDAEDLQALADVMDDWAAENFRTTLSTSSTYLGVEVRGLENEFDLIAVQTAGAGVGSASSAPLPNNSACCVARKSVYTGKNTRGRVFWPLYQSALDGNEDYVSTGFLTGVRDQLDLVKGVMLSELWVESIVSRWLHGVKRPEGINYAVNHYENATARVASKRKRMPK